MINYCPAIRVRVIAPEPGSPALPDIDGGKARREVRCTSVQHQEITAYHTVYLPRYVSTARRSNWLVAYYASIYQGCASKFRRVWIAKHRWDVRR